MKIEHITIWQFSRVLSSRLMNINLFNIWLGRRLIRQGEFWRGVGTQAVGWGVINIAIAAFGLLNTRSKLDKLDDVNDPEAAIEQTRGLRRALRINAPLNLLYMWGGYRLAARSGENTYRRGTGWGIVLQGFILLCFDTFHLSKVLKIKTPAQRDTA
ncbi:MAG: DUF6992 family protein [Chloroflexota bacterium]